MNDPVVIAAALLHDTFEDTRTAYDEVRSMFGTQVADVVIEVTDVKFLATDSRKRVQVARAGRASERARLVRLADKICNLCDILASPPAGRSSARQQKYFDWAKEVVDQARGVNSNLERKMQLLGPRGRIGVDRTFRSRYVVSVYGGNAMKRLLAVLMSVAVSGLMLGSPARAADETADCAATIKLFQGAGESASFFKKSYGYAVFPTIGKAGLGVGGAHGSGCVFAQGKQVGTAKMNQLSFGWQAGAQGYSLLVFFEDERSFKEFTSGNFEFGAKASAVAITAGASAGASTGGTSSGASASKKDATTQSRTGYEKGMASFSIIKGGLMYEAALGGAKFKFKPL
ncbi:MAG: HD domain-containing protein [Steroidobacteraceae bacterium]|nr:HD domain-containing protein [Steroidobacteraceae bacterium]MBP7012905.1 HD domain-containing protein [Steroidobacteraceae bacterium]